MNESDSELITQWIKNRAELVEEGGPDNAAAEGYPLGHVALKKEICQTCKGRGATWHGRRSHDAVSFSQSEWAELGDETQDDYMGGNYDEPCPECKGNNVVDVLNEESSDPEVVAAIHEYMKDAYESFAIDRAEARAFGYI